MKKNPKNHFDIKIIQFLIKDWKNCSDQTADFIKAVPPPVWNSKPFQFRFKTFSWEFACIIQTRFRYQEALRTGKLSFSGSAAKIAEFQSEQRKSIINKLNISAVQLVKIIGKLNSAKQADLIIWLMQHERLHQGKLLLYLATKGLRIPASFKKTWG